MKAFLFPGQGTQNVGMGKDFYGQFSAARETFEEADELLGRKLSRLIFEGPLETLTETQNSQVAIFVTSVAILRCLAHEKPDVVAGLSLGEYTALAASGRLTFAETLALVQKRGELMSRACEEAKGTMAVVLGLSSDEVSSGIEGLLDVWAANFNCPGQVVISGTVEGVKRGSEALLAKGAKRVLPLHVHGAFHSGLMQSAKDGLSEYVNAAKLEKSAIQFVMNVPGDFVKSPSAVKKNLIAQVTGSVCWEQGVKALDKSGVTHYIEIGPGKTLAGFNKRIGVAGTTISIEKVEDLHEIA